MLHQLDRVPVADRVDELAIRRALGAEPALQRARRRSEPACDPIDVDVAVAELVADRGPDLVDQVGCGS